MKEIFLDSDLESLLKEEGVLVDATITALSKKYNLIIRLIAESDTDKIKDLMEQLGYQNTSEQIRLRIQQWRMSDFPGKAWVAVKNNEIVGCIAILVLDWFHHDASSLRIAALIIDQNYRRQGIGSALLAVIEAYAKQHGCESIELTSGLHRIPTGTYDFYFAHGYKNVSDSTTYIVKRFERR
jgi:GNAT superfamily N-acetyltransferase